MFRPRDATSIYIYIYMTLVAWGLKKRSSITVYIQLYLKFKHNYMFRPYVWSHHQAEYRTLNKKLQNKIQWNCGNETSVYINVQLHRLYKSTWRLQDYVNDADASTTQICRRCTADLTDGEQWEASGIPRAIAKACNAYGRWTELETGNNINYRSCP